MTTIASLARGADSARIDTTEASSHEEDVQGGDHVVWNSEAGHVSGRIIKVHTKDVDYKGYTHHASKDEPQYEIRSDKTDHIAMHKGAALSRVDD